MFVARVFDVGRQLGGKPFASYLGSGFAVENRPTEPQDANRMASYLRTRKGKDGRPTLGLVEMALAPPAESEDEEDEEEGVRPMEAWLNAGELGVPLVFMPVPTCPEPEP